MPNIIKNIKKQNDISSHKPKITHNLVGTGVLDCPFRPSNPVGSIHESPVFADQQNKSLPPRGRWHFRKKMTEGACERLFDRSVHCERGNEDLRGLPQSHIRSTAPSPREPLVSLRYIKPNPIWLSYYHSIILPPIPKNPLVRMCPTGSLL